MYEIRQKRLPILMIVVFSIIWSILIDYYGYSIRLFLIILFMAIVIALLRFHFSIFAEQLIYEIQIFKKPLRSRKILPNDIK